MRQQLCTETDGKAVKRFTSALLYEQRISRAEIERLLGFPEQTVYDWLDVVAERSWIALGDLPRFEQFTWITDEQWMELTATPPASPSETGYDGPTWTPGLVRDHIAEAFEVEYSLAHIYRVMTRAGCLVRQTRPRHYNADPAAQQRWREAFKTSGRR